MLHTKEKIKTHILRSVIFFFENPSIYEIMWKNIVQPRRPPMKVWRVRISWWIPKATNTHSEYIILVAFPLRQWLYERHHCYVIRTLPGVSYATGQ